MKYELSFIISSTIPENEHSKIQEQVLAYLDEVKAKHDKEFFSLGRKKLAYPIKKQRNGFYIFTVFELEEKEVLKDLDIKLKHNSNILRHLIIKKDKASASKSPAEQVKEYQEKTTDDKEGPKTNSKDVAENKKEDVKVNLDDIDKKLDDLLDE